MWVIPQHDKPEDFVIATGVAHSVREFVEIAFKHAGIEIAWRGEGVQEEGYDKNTEKVLVVVDPLYFRPTEVEVLIGDASKAQKVLGWNPQISFEELVKEMMEHDLKSI